MKIHVTLNWWSRFAAVSLAVTLTFALVVGGLSADGARKADLGNDRGLRAFDVSNIRGAFDEHSERPEIKFADRDAFWPFAKGPHYGEIAGNRYKDRDVLKLNVGSFSFRDNPRGPDVAADLRRNDMASKGIQTGSEFYLVALKNDAFKGATLDTTKADLIKKGARIIRFIPNSAYLMEIPGSDYNRITNHGMVAWVGPYEPAYKIAPNTGRVPVLDQAYANGVNWNLKLTLYPGMDGEAVMANLRGMGGEITYVWQDAKSFTVGVKINRARLSQVAQIREIAYVEEERIKIAHNAESQQVVQLGEVSQAYGTGGTPFWALGIDGSGFIFGGIDDGMDIDAGSWAHSAADAVGNPVGLTHRKVVAYTTVGSTGDGTPVAGYNHGQVTTSCMGGYSSEIDPDPTPSDAIRFDGPARGARLYFGDGASDVSGFGGIDERGFHRNVDGPWGDGSLGVVSNHSYGLGVTLGTNYVYGTGDLNQDNYMFDENMMFLAFWSAGNDGTSYSGGSCDGQASRGPGVLDSPIKNGLNIGASDQDPNQSNMASFSSHGFDDNPAGNITSCSGTSNWTTPLRTMPTLVTPGHDSAGGAWPGIRVDQSSDAAQTGAAEFQQTQSFQSGTSFSSPTAAGAAVLVWDYFQEGFHPSGTGGGTSHLASGQLVKAALIASTDMVTGGKATSTDTGVDTTKRFTRAEGYGYINLSNVLALSNVSVADNPNAPTGTFIYERGWNGATGAPVASSGMLNASPADDQTLNLTDNTLPLRVALAWADPGNRDLINDLDLTVTSPNGEVFVGNDFVGAFTPADSGATADDLNNTEAVFISPSVLQGLTGGGTGAWTVSTSVGAGGINTASGLTDGQPFALIASGGITIGSNVSHDKGILTCGNTLTVTVNETSGGTTANSVGNNVTIRVYDGSAALVDTETGNFTFTQPDGGVLRFVSESIPVVEGAPSNNDGQLSVFNGYSVETTYADPDDFDPKASSFVDCSIEVGGTIPGYFVVGGCDDDDHLDAGEQVALNLGVVNTSVNDLQDATASIVSSNADVNFVDSTVWIGELRAGELTTVAFNAWVADSAVDRQKTTVTLSITSPGDGRTVADTLVFSIGVESDDYVKPFDEIWTFDDTTTDGLGSWGEFPVFDNEEATPSFWEQLLSCAGSGSEHQQSGDTGPEGDQGWSTGDGIFKSLGGTSNCTSNHRTAGGTKKNPDTLDIIAWTNDAHASRSAEDLTAKRLTETMLDDEGATLSNGGGHLEGTHMTDWYWYHKWINPANIAGGYGWSSFEFIPDIGAYGDDPYYWFQQGPYALSTGTVPEWEDFAVVDNWWGFNFDGFFEGQGMPVGQFGLSYMYWLASETAFGFAGDDVTLLYYNNYWGSDSTDDSGDACNAVGQVSFNQYQYSDCEGLVTITVVDTNAGGGPLTATVVSGLEPGGEAVSLVQDSGDTNKYVGTIYLTATANVAGKLTVGPNEAYGSLVATYTDANPAGDSEAFAGTNCEGGGLFFDKFFVNTSGTTLGTNVGVDHDGDEFADSGETISVDLRLSNTDVFTHTGITVEATSASTDIDCFVDSMASFNDINAATTGLNQAGDFITFRLKNSVACTDPGAPSTLVIDLTVRSDQAESAGSPQTFFMFVDVNQTGTTGVTIVEGFGSGIPATWLAANLGDNDPVDGETCTYVNHTWHANPTDMPTPAVSMGNSDANGANTGSYPDLENSGLRTPPLQISTANTTLTFDHAYAIEPNWDAAIVEYRTGSDGETWGAWDFVSGLNPAGTSLSHDTCSPWLPAATPDPYDTNYFTNAAGTPGAPLSASSDPVAVGANNWVQFRFHFGSDGTISGFGGWWIDNVGVTNTLQPVYECDTDAPVSAACAAGGTLGPTPDGVFGTGIGSSTADGGTTLSLSYDVGTCANVSANHNVLWGNGSGIGSLTLAGSVCGSSETDGAITWNSSPAVTSGNWIWYLIVGDDGAGQEGAWGDNSGGTERSSNQSGECSTSSWDATGTCN